MNAVPKLLIVRDRKYLDSLRLKPCILTGVYGTEFDAVDPMHIGTLGRSIKSSDDEALPVLHSLHRLGHDKGEISMLREHMPNWLIREALRAYAREQYQLYLIHHSEPDTGLPQPKTTPPGPPPSEHPNSARQSGRANSGEGCA